MALIKYYLKGLGHSILVYIVQIIPAVHLFWKNLDQATVTDDLLALQITLFYTLTLT